MSYGEQYHPDGSERFGFIEPSFFSDLASAEFEVDQPYELDTYLQKLKADYASAVFRAIPFLASGIMLDTDGEESYQTFYGRITGFAIAESLGKHRIMAGLHNNQSGEHRQMVISARAGYESSLLADNLYESTEFDTSKWRHLVKRCDNAAELLGHVTSDFAFMPFDELSVDEMLKLEELLKDAYGVHVGAAIYVTGTQAYRGDGKTTIMQNYPSPQGEASYAGQFLGLTLYELTTAKNRKESRLCAAVLLDDDSVVLQPCHSAHTISVL